MTAGELRRGDVLVTKIGRALIKSIEPKADGLEIVLDADAEGSTRAPAQGTVLFFRPTDRVRVARKAPPPRVSLPLDDDRPSDDRQEALFPLDVPASGSQVLLAALDDRMRALYRRLGIVPPTLPLPPEDVPPPPKHWADTECDDEVSLG